KRHRSRGQKRKQHIAEDVSEQNPTNPSNEGEQDTFRKELADDPAATGAERHTNRHLALPRGPSRQEKIGHIRAGNEQDASSGNQKQERNILCCVLISRATESLRFRLFGRNEND